MARNKPGQVRDADAPHVPTTPDPRDPHGEPGSHLVEPGTDDDGRVHAGIVELTDPAPVVGSATTEAPEPKPVRYVVEQGGNVVIGGACVLLREGKVLDARSYDIQSLLKAGGRIRLRLLED